MRNKPRWYWVLREKNLLTFWQTDTGKWYSLHYYQYHQRQMYIKTINSAEHNLPKHWTWV